MASLLSSLSPPFFSQKCLPRSVSCYCQGRVDFSKNVRVCRRLLVLPAKCLSSGPGGRDAESEDETTTYSSDSTYKWCAALGGIGFAEATYLTYLKLTNSDAFCQISGGSCGDILNRDYAVVFGTTLLRYKIPTRGLLGLRNAILIASRGTAILNTIFDSYGPWAGDISTRDQGSPVAFEDGTTTSYALSSSQERGQMFVGPGVDIYKGQIVGIHQRPGDLSLNVCKKKAATNIRSNKEQTVVLDTPMDCSLDDCIEYIQEDELVGVTPLSIRMCKNPKLSKKTR